MLSKSKRLPFYPKQNGLLYTAYLISTMNSAWNILSSQSRNSRLHWVVRPCQLFFSERPDRKGARLSVRAILSSYMKTAGIDRPRVTPHSARHYAASAALQNGATLKDLQEMLGHASLGSTENCLHMVRRLSDGAEHRIPVGKGADVSAVLPEGKIKTD